MKHITTIFIVVFCLFASMNAMAVDVTIDNIKYSLNMSERTASVAGSTLEHVVVPETIINDGLTYRVTAIANLAFKKNITVKTVKCGNTIEKIGDYAFSNAELLEKLIIGNSVTHIGAWAFESCTRLKYIVIPQTIMSTGQKPFYLCNNLSIICLKEGFNTNQSSQTIYPSSFYTFDHDTFDYNGKSPVVNYTFNGIGQGFQPTSETMDVLDATVGTHTSYLHCSFANEDMSFDVDIPYTYTINPVTLTARVKNASRLYGDADPEFTSTYTGFVNGENASVLTSHGAYTTTATAKSDVGTYTVKQSGATAQNYVFTYEEGTLTVNKAPLTMTANNKTITYGNKLPTFDVTYTGLKNNETKPKWNTEPTITTNATSDSNAGTYSIKINNADAKNYTLTIENGTLTIEKAPLFIKADSKSKQYCENNPELTYTCEGFVKNETTAALSTKPKLSTTATKTSAAGIYPIEVKGAKATNYSISYQNAELTIKKRQLTATAKNYTRAYGEDNPEFEVQYSGFVNNEDESILLSKPKATTTATATSDVGEYDIKVSDGVAENYNFTYVKGKLTVEKAYQTLTWDQDFSDVKLYDQVELTAEASSGLEITYSVEGGQICSVMKIGKKQYLDCTGEGEAVIVAVQKGNNNYWETTKMYKTIVIKSPTGIISVASDIDKDTKIYDISGNQLNTLQKGINIIRYSDGTTKKVVVK